MEEAEALSTRLAIMVEGKIKCIGPVQTIKNQYGKGFEIETKMNLPNINDIYDLMKNTKITSHEDLIDAEQIKSTLAHLGESELMKEISGHDSGSHIYTQVFNFLFKYFFS